MQYIPGGGGPRIPCPYAPAIPGAIGPRGVLIPRGLSGPIPGGPPINGNTQNRLK